MIRKVLFIILFFLLTIPARAQQVGLTSEYFGQDACIWWEEEDGDPYNNFCGKMKVSNGSLTDNGDGSFSLSTSGGSGSGASALTGLTDVVQPVTYTSGNILIANGTKFASKAMVGHCTLASGGFINCNPLGAAKSLTGLSDVGSATVTAGNLLLADGTSFQSKAMTGDVSITSAGVADIASGVVGATELSSTTVTAGSYNASNVSVDADGRITFASQGQLTSLSDVATSTKTAANLLIADGTSFQSKSVTGDVTITSAGVTDLGSSVVGATELASTTVTAGSYNAANVSVDADGRILFAAQGQLTSLSDVATSTKTAANLLIADGTSFQSKAVTGDISITSAGVTDIGSGTVGATELSSTLVTAGTYNASNTTIDADGRVTFASQGQLTSLSDVSSSTKTAGNLLIADGTNFQSKAMSGDCTISSAGAMTCSAATSGWTDDGPIVRLTTATNDVTVGATSFTSAAFAVAPVPNKVFVSGTLGVGTTAPTELLAVVKSQDASTTILVNNASNGTNGVADFRAVNDTGAKLEAGMLGSGWTTAGALVASSGYVYSDGSAGLEIMTNNSTGAIKFATGGTTEKARLSTAGNLGIGTTEPLQKVDINGQLRVNGAIIGATAGAVASLTGISDVGSATATAGNMLIADGTKFQSKAISGSCTITSAGVISCSAGSATGVTAGSYNAANISVNSTGNLTFASQGQLTSLSDVGSSTKTAGNLLIANGTSFQSKAVSGDITITSAGVSDIGSDKVGPTEMASTLVTAGSYNAASLSVDADGRILFAAQGQLTSLSDVASSTKTAGNLLIANGTNFASVALSGNHTITSAGVVTSNITFPAFSITDPVNSRTYVGPKVAITGSVSSCTCRVAGGTNAPLTLKQCNGSGASCTNMNAATTCTTSDTSITLGAGANAAVTAGNELQFTVGTQSGTNTDLRGNCNFAF